MQRRASSKKRRTASDLTKPVEHPRMPIAVLFRVFVIGVVGIVASAYAIYRHYTFARPSMLAPASSATPPEASGPWMSITDLVPETPSASASTATATATATQTATTRAPAASASGRP